MRRIPWPYVLPFCNTVVAAVLLYLGGQERAHYFADKMSAWDYIPPATQIAYLINFPAYILWSAARTLLPAGALAQNGCFLVLILALWYLIGVWVANKESFLSLARVRRARAWLICTVAIVGTATVGLFALADLSLHPLLGLGGLCWCLSLAWLSVFTMTQGKEKCQRAPG